MLGTIKTWLNGGKNYFTGVLLYEQTGKDKRLLELFKKGPSDFSKKKLQDELQAICDQLKSTDEKPASQKAIPPAKKKEIITSSPLPKLPHQKIDPGTNPQLYEACIAEANKVYKEAMNLRAELFLSAKANDFEDPNRPDRVQQRSKIAVNVVEGYKAASGLYDKAEYVRINGRLPEQPALEPDDESDYDNIPDHMVKQELDNLRKNYNKMKKRPQTPERVALLQKHEMNIKKLEDKWHSLKPKK